LSKALSSGFQNLFFSRGPEPTRHDFISRDAFLSISEAGNRSRFSSYRRAFIRALDFRARQACGTMIAVFFPGSAAAPNLRESAHLMSVSSKLKIAVCRAELCLVWRSACVVSILPLLLRRWGIRRIVERLTPPGPLPPARRLPRERVIYLCLRVLDGAEKMRFRIDCLRRSLLLFHCLRMHGFPVVIHFGAKPRASGLEGHCWLTVDGALIQDRSSHVLGFTHMFSLPLEAETNRGRCAEAPAIDGILFDR